MIEPFRSELPGFGFWSDTKIVFGSPFTYTLVVKPDAFNIFSASATVLFLISGTTIELLGFLLLEASSSEGTPK